VEDFITVVSEPTDTGKGEYGHPCEIKPEDPFGGALEDGHNRYNPSLA
jgi:hypothetical protein